MKMNKKRFFWTMRSISWDWVVVGLQLLATGGAIYYNSLFEENIDSVFYAFSRPFWVYLPFIIGLITIFIGVTNIKNKIFSMLILISLTLYWSTLVTLLLIDDIGSNHVPVTAIIALFIVPKIWTMAFQTSE